MTRAENVAEARRLTALGLNQREIGERMGAHRATVNDWLCDPDRAKALARRASYAGVCRECGAATDGSNGRGLAPDLCRRCTPRKTWTREAVIEAIQRWARTYGKPPTATEWVRGDPDAGHPDRSSVYRTQARSTSPFKRWADAIEAAGFPRPGTGSYPHHKGRSHIRYQGGKDVKQYVVLESAGDGLWREHTVEGFNEATAIEEAASAMNGVATDRTFVAVLSSQWHVRRLTQVTVFKAELVGT